MPKKFSPGGGAVIPFLHAGLKVMHDLCLYMIIINRLRDGQPTTLSIIDISLVLISRFWITNMENHRNEFVYILSYYIVFIR